MNNLPKVVHDSAVAGIQTRDHQVSWDLVHASTTTTTTPV